MKHITSRLNAWVLTKHTKPIKCWSPTCDLRHFSHILLLFLNLGSRTILPPDILWGGHQSSGAATEEQVPVVVIIISRNMKTLQNRLLLNNKMQDFPARYSGKLWNAAWLLDNHPSPRRKHCFVLKLCQINLAPVVLHCRRRSGQNWSNCGMP